MSEVGPVFEACCALLPGVDPASLEVQVSTFRHVGQCQRHRDRGNVGLSAAAFLGGFSAGGGLRTQTGRLMSQKFCWHVFDGVQDEHWVDPWPEGEERLSLVALRRVSGKASSGSERRRAWRSYSPSFWRTASAR